jgi:hypothetical protein
MTSIRKVLSVAAASLVLGVAALSFGAAAPAEAKGKHYHNGHFHKWHGHRFHNRHFYVQDYGCYWKWSKYGKVKVCPYVPY